MAIDNLGGSKCLLLGMGCECLSNIPIGGRYLGNSRVSCGLTKNKQFIIDNVRRALDGYGAEQEATCFVQAYNQRMSDNEYLDMPNLNATCGDFFLAGQETTATTLRWAMIIIAKYDQVQDKLREEIHKVVGRDRLPSMADQIKMPFARACVLELQRFANILPTNLQRVTVRNTEIRGHKIPADTWINADIHYVMANDPNFVLVERTIPFSIGKRACAGEALARVELFLALTSTIQQFRISPCDGQSIDIEPRPGIIIHPIHQQLRIQTA